MAFSWYLQNSFSVPIRWLDGHALGTEDKNTEENTNTDTQMKTKSENSYFVAVIDLLPDESSLSWKTDLTL